MILTRAIVCIGLLLSTSAILSLPEFSAQSKKELADMTNMTTVEKAKFYGKTVMNSGGATAVPTIVLTAIANQPKVKNKLNPWVCDLLTLTGFGAGVYAESVWNEGDENTYTRYGSMAPSLGIALYSIGLNHKKSLLGLFVKTELQKPTD